MAAIDLEAEYDNRARVANSAEIAAGWLRDSNAYRTQMKDADRAELNVNYGSSARQFLDIFYPKDRDDAPVALFIHGGYWRARDPTAFSHVARGLNERGFNVALVGYDLCPQVEIKDIVGQVRKACLFLWERFNRPILAYGHSAGGHLAACVLATEWQALDPTVPANLVPAAYAISGLFDLAPFVEIAMNRDLRLTPEDARRMSPVRWPAPAGRLFDAVVGSTESSEYLRQSKGIVDAWTAGGTAARYEEIADANHYTIIAPLSDPGSAMTERLAALNKITKADN
jgi:arylformamidase